MNREQICTAILLVMLTIALCVQGWYIRTLREDVAQLKADVNQLEQNDRRIVDTQMGIIRFMHGEEY